MSDKRTFYGTGSLQQALELAAIDLLPRRCIKARRTLSTRAATTVSSA